MDNIRRQLDSTLNQHVTTRAALETALADAAREADALLTLKPRGQVDDDTFERRRLQILDRQAKIRLQLDAPVPSPDDLLSRVQEVLNFSVSLPQAFCEGDAVRRRQILHAVCANPTVRDRKALYIAKEPYSFFEGQGLTRTWWTLVERLRTWIIDLNFQIPPLYLDLDENKERQRRAGVLRRRPRLRQRGRDIVP